jgi:UDP-N-acetylmuramoyl-L-alanyl-D-glutamate--2,6-diaminopimelate ligase
MIKLNIKDLLDGVEYDFKVSGLQIDSRMVKPGDLFVCIKGYTVDGHDYAAQAAANGAVGIVAERHVEGVNIPQIIIQNTGATLPLLAHSILKKPTENMNLFGVTGTNGKTTVSYMMEHLLQCFDAAVGYIGTNGIRYADITHEPVNTTPNALDLQATFADMIKRGVHNVSLEVSSHALALHRVDCCKFQVAIFTNLTPEHLDFHPTMEDYFEAKYKLFTMLEDDGYGIINIDDTYGIRIADRMRRLGANIYTYGVDNDADFKATHIKQTPTGTHFMLKFKDDIYPVVAPTLGLFNVYNALGAIAGVVSAGMSIETAIAAIGKLPIIAGRMELIDAGQDFTVIVDYAHTPDGVEKVLEFAQGIKKEAIRLVIGCPGDRDRTKRPVMANLAVNGADDVVFTTDDPHTEDPVAILEEMVKGLSTKNFEVVVDRKSAIERIFEKAKKGDVIIIAGRGHQKLQYFKNENIEFDDRAVVRDVLREIV